MKPAELAKQCADNINSCVKLGFSMEDANICITTPQGWKAPPKFPRGEIVQWKEDGTRVRYLKAVNVLAWLAAHFPDQVKVQAMTVDGQGT